MIASGLLAQGHEVHIVTVGDAAGVEQYKGVEVHIMRSPNVYWDYFFTKRPTALKMLWHVLENFNPRAYWRLRPHLKAFRSDVVMTASIENINVATWLLARMHKVPVVHVIQSYFLACWRDGLFKNGANCTGQCGSCKVLPVGKKPMSHLVDGVFGETRFVVDQHLELGYFKHATSAVIPGPVFPIAGRMPKVRDGKLVVGYMGVLAPHKGVDVLADAARLMGPNSNVRFLIGGTGEDEAYVASLREKFGDADVEFMGWVKPDDVYPLSAVRRAVGAIEVEGAVWPHGRRSAGLRRARHLRAFRRHRREYPRKREWLHLCLGPARRTDHLATRRAGTGRACAHVPGAKCAAAFAPLRYRHDHRAHQRFRQRDRGQLQGTPVSGAAA